MPRQCVGCGKGPGDLYLHHGKLFCALCLVADESDDMAVKVNIAIVRAAAMREAAKRMRRR